MDQNHPMLEFVDPEVVITGSVIDGRAKQSVFFYRYPTDPNQRVYEISFHHVGRNGYVFKSSDDPAVALVRKHNEEVKAALFQ